MYVNPHFSVENNNNDLIVTVLYNLLSFSDDIHCWSLIFWFSCLFALLAEPVLTASSAEE